VFFETNYPYNFKADLARTLILRENGGIYLDADYQMIRDDMEELLSQYDQIFTLEIYKMPLIATHFYATIPYGAIINAIYEQVEFNLNVHG
jgi:mannosyltransferase OCH1-like enzyme